MKSKINLLKTFLNLKAGNTTSTYITFNGEKMFSWKDGFYFSIPFETELSFITDLKEFVRVADGHDFLNFELKSDNVQIKINKTRFKIPLIEEEMVNDVLDLSDATDIDFNNSKIFLENLKKVEKFVAEKDVRHYLEGVSLKGTEMGATNGHIAIMIKDCGFNIEKPIILPRITIEFLLKAKLTVKTLFLEMKQDGETPNRISFQFENGELFSSPLIDARFPEISGVIQIYENLTPNELPQQEFFEALKSLKPIKKDVGVRLSSTQVSVEEHSFNGAIEATAEVELPGMLDGVGFNLEYLQTLDGLADKLYFIQKDPDSALIAFSDDRNILVALMPMRL